MTGDICWKRRGVGGVTTTRRAKGWSAKGRVLSRRRDPRVAGSKGEGVSSQLRNPRIAGTKSTWKKLGHNSGREASMTPSQNNLRTISLTKFPNATRMIKLTKGQILPLPPNPVMAISVTVHSKNILPLGYRCPRSRLS